MYGCIKMRFGQILVYLMTPITNKFCSNSEGKKLVLGSLKGNLEQKNGKY